MTNPTSNNQQPTSTLIDVGTGCGVLGLSCALHAGEYINQLYLTEYYPETLEVARRNLEKYQQSCQLSVVSCQNDVPTTNNQQPATLQILSTTKLLNCSLLDHPVLSTLLSPTTSNQQPATNIIIVANLPYIPTQLFEDNVEDNVKLREPKAAFVGGEDGLDWYREMLQQVINCQLSVVRPTTSNQQPITLFLEMMTRQVDILAREFAEYFSFEEVATFHMNIRIVKVLWNG